jgi:hypothetical protein
MKKLKSSLDIALEFNDRLVNRTEDGRNNTINLEVFVDMINAAQFNAIEYTVQRCADEAEINCKKKSQYGKHRKWQKVKDGEAVDIFSYEMQYFVNKKSILNVADKIKNELK